MIVVGEQNLMVDVLEELSAFEFPKARNRGTELTSCSPFRDESSPSFSINLETGQWIDFGATGDSLGKGNLVTLLAMLRHETYENIERYLIQKYGIENIDLDTFKLDVQLEKKKAAPKYITDEQYAAYRFRHPYLMNRGISEKVQNAFNIGYDRVNYSVAFPWYDRDGKMVNVKFRSVRSKHFHYADGQPIRNHLYGIHLIHRLTTKSLCAVVESEIDALYLWTCGHPAVAIGGSNVTSTQIELLRRSGVSEIVIATDNDSVGQKTKQKIANSLLGYVRVSEIEFPDGRKDVNDMTPVELENAIQKRRVVNPFALQSK